VNAPTITIADIHSKIKAATYTLLSDGRTTICQLTLENGYTVIGKSACVSAENYNQALGEKFAFEDAVNAIWPLEGYLLKERLFREDRGDVNSFAQEQATATRAHMIDVYAALGVRFGDNPFHRIEALVANQPQDVQAHPLDKIARLCHEVNRAYCQALGDDSQVSWEDAPEWQRESERMGVDMHLMGDFGPEASHIGWMNQKIRDGWTYGPVKDAEKKEHPCMVAFELLPREQQAKDHIFRAIVHCFK
jgi:hypothetical protein